MTNEEYVEKMNVLGNALSTAYMMTLAVSEEDLLHMEETCRRARSMSFFMVAPTHFNKANKNVEDQQTLMRWVREMQAAYRQLKGMEEVSLVDQD